MQSTVSKDRTEQLYEKQENGLATYLPFFYTTLVLVSFCIHLLGMTNPALLLLAAPSLTEVIRKKHRASQLSLGKILGKMIPLSTPFMMVLISPQPLVFVVAGSLLCITTHHIFRRGIELSILILFGAGYYSLLTLVNNLSLSSNELFKLSMLSVFIVCLIAIFSVIALNKKLAQAEHQNNELKKQLENSKLLVRSMCHDLASPVFALTSAKHILKISNSEKDTERFSKIMDSSLDHLANYIQKVREFIMVSNKEKSITKANIFNIFEELQAIYQQKLEEKNITLKYQHIPRSLEVIADSTMLQSSIFSNLINNAIKFSPENSCIKITARKKNLKTGWLPYNKNQAYTEILVTDQGKGISDVFKPDLFKGYIKTSSKGTKGEMGTGFGLPIAYKTALLLNCKLELLKTNADPHKGPTGTTFRLIV